MTDVRSDPSAFADDVSTNVRPRCPRCHAGTEHLPPAARFCPRCGVTLADRLGPAPVIPPPLPRVPPDDPFKGHPGFAVPAPTDIVAGYAEALYQLGLRYEAGVGWKHHPFEAVRCFAKAARLGNAKALERLALAPDVSVDDFNDLPGEFPPPLASSAPLTPAV